MLIQNLRFNPHVVWAKNGDFHIFGYINNNYHYHRLSDGFTKTWYKRTVPSQQIGRLQDGVNHFNKVAHKDENTVDFMRYGIYANFDHTTNHLVFINGHHDLLQKTFPLNGFLRRSDVMKANKINAIASSANFDNFEDRLVFAWGDSFLYETPTDAILIKQEYTRENGRSSCTDAKFSPDGKKIAVSVKDGIKFLYSNNLELERELFVKDCKIHFMSYSEDGLTIAAITTCRKCIVWDVD